MLVIIKSKADEEVIKKAAEDFAGYIKIVVDIEKEVLTAGGLRHADGEQLLINEGSHQKNLWGGGLDLETFEIDYDSMINVRPNDGNSSREVLSAKIRQKMEKIITSLLK